MPCAVPVFGGVTKAKHRVDHVQPRAWLGRKQPRPQKHQAFWRQRSQHDERSDIYAPKETLSKQSSERMRQYDGWFRKFVDRPAYVRQIVVQPRRSGAVAPVALAMPAKTDGSRISAVRSEVGKETLRPHPCAAKSTVKEENRSTWRRTRTRFDELQRRFRTPRMQEAHGEQFPVGF